MSGTAQTLLAAGRDQCGFSLEAETIGGDYQSNHPISFDPEHVKSHAAARRPISSSGAVTLRGRIDLLSNSLIACANALEGIEHQLSLFAQELAQKQAGTAPAPQSDLEGPL